MVPSLCLQLYVVSAAYKEQNIVFTDHYICLYVGRQINDRLLYNAYEHLKQRQ